MPPRSSKFKRSDFEHLGRVFLSHASPDKPFVRRLARDLEKEGVKVWLDEHDLLVGDSLPEEVFEAINRANAVIVVISHASLKSKWLRNEVRAAAQRMIDGSCRLIPVLIDEVEPPPELTGLLYADCRRGQRGGRAKILNALADEAKRARERVATMDSSDIHVRFHGRNRAVRSVFDGMGWASGQISATRSIDFETVTVTTRHGRDVDVVYEDLTDYGILPDVVGQEDWDDWKSKVTDEYGERFGLLVSERPISATVRSSLRQVSDHVWCERLPASYSGPGGAMVLVHIGLPITDAETEARLSAAREVLEFETTAQVPQLSTEWRDRLRDRATPTSGKASAPEGDQR